MANELNEYVHRHERCSVQASRHLRMVHWRRRGSANQDGGIARFSQPLRGFGHDLRRTGSTPMRGSPAGDDDDVLARSYPEATQGRLRQRGSFLRQQDIEEANVWTPERALLEPLENPK